MYSWKLNGNKPIAKTTKLPTPLCKGFFWQSAVSSKVCGKFKGLLPLLSVMTTCFISHRCGRGSNTVSLLWLSFSIKSSPTYKHLICPITEAQQPMGTWWRKVKLWFQKQSKEATAKTGPFRQEPRGNALTAQACLNKSDLDSSYLPRKSSITEFSELISILFQNTIPL